MQLTVAISIVARNRKGSVSGLQMQALPGDEQLQQEGPSCQQQGLQQTVTFHDDTTSRTYNIDIMDVLLQVEANNETSQAMPHSKLKGRAQICNERS